MADTQCPISVMFFTRDVKKSVAFYRDMLGFACKETWPSESDPKWANLMLGNQSVMFSAHLPEAEARQMCAKDPDNLKYMLALAADFERNKPGVGVVIYLVVEDIDRYHTELRRRGIQAPSPRDQFYGLREMPVEDPNGYRLLFYQTIQMAACQSCGMPLSNAKPGQMYCPYCTDEQGRLRPWDHVFEGTVTGYFMAMHKMDRPTAEQAAREHLGRMPAWMHTLKREPASAAKGAAQKKPPTRARSAVVEPKPDPTSRRAAIAKPAAKAKAATESKPVARPRPAVKRKALARRR